MITATGCLIAGSANSGTIAVRSINDGPMQLPEALIHLRMEQRILRSLWCGFADRSPIVSVQMTPCRREKYQLLDCHVVPQTLCVKPDIWGNPIPPQSLQVPGEVFTANHRLEVPHQISALSRDCGMLCIEIRGKPKRQRLLVAQTALDIAHRTVDQQGGIVALRGEE